MTIEETIALAAQRGPWWPTEKGRMRNCHGECPIVAARNYVEGRTARSTWKDNKNALAIGRERLKLRPEDCVTIIIAADYPAAELETAADAKTRAAMFEKLRAMPGVKVYDD